ncbi:alpha/beta fold hydrolase [Legionella sp. W05-934-2]|jgi:pimeloyl-ACP methyl ester carboxylesterase|uniref:alpha/beta fold hydrolase n=1 Tax=Legionella sp. W05-934-2 TaxID=1198649 RepID=UPI003462768C
MTKTTINGCEYFYESQGDSPETILFSHGLLMTHEAFREQIDYFKSTYRTVIFDHRGHGKTQTTDNGYELDSLTNDISALIEFLNIGKIHYVGHSMGGFIGLRLAARRPDLVKSLVLLNTSAEAEAHMWRYRLLRFITQALGVKFVANSVHKLNFSKKFHHNPKREAVSRFWLNHFSSLPKTIIQAADPVLNRASVESELANISCPTLIIGGKEDIALSPQNSQLMHEKIAHSSLTLFEKVGHCAMIEEPDAVNQLIAQFLQSLPKDN